MHLGDAVFLRFLPCLDGDKAPIPFCGVRYRYTAKKSVDLVLLWCYSGHVKILDVPQSGSVGGVTSSRNRYGQYRRARATPVNPSTPFQTAARLSFGAISVAWKGLTADQRESWNALADTVPWYDSLGQQIRLTGQAFFLKLNMQRATVGDPVVTDPPLPPTGWGNQVVSITTLSVESGSPQNLTFTVSHPVIPALYKLTFWASPPLSRAVTFNNNVRFMAVKPAGAAGSVLLAVPYKARFGAPLAGQKIYVWSRLYFNGFTGPKFETSGIVITST